MKKFFSAILCLAIYQVNNAQVDARLFRFPDVSQNQIAFVYGGDIWVVPKSGGTAVRLTSSTGEESFPRFSPDGKSLAFSASYDGNNDAYAIPVTGGLPKRLTWNGLPDRVVDWHPDGKRILIASPRENNVGGVNKFFLVPSSGGFAEALPIPYGELGSFSGDGNSIAYVTKITENYPFKRIRSGLASDVYIYDLKNKKAENITGTEEVEGKPAWIKNKIYYISDAGSNSRRNIWAYDRDSKKSSQITNFAEDINHMSAGNDELVFVAGGKLFLLNVTNNKHTEIAVKIVSDQSTLMQRTVNVGSKITNFNLTSDANRAVFEARGELFSIPAENGVIINLTNTSGAFERLPAYSNNGKWLAYWSDESGEHEIHLLDNSSGSSKKLTGFGKGMGWHLRWSPDNKMIAFINDMQEIRLVTIPDGKVTTIDKTTKLTYSGLQGFKLSWSPDSKWLAYDKQGDNDNSAIYLYDVAGKKVHQATSGYYNDEEPVFDRTGKHIFFTTDRNLNPLYSNLDNTYIYPNTRQLAVATLNPDTKSLLFPKNDELKISDTGTSADKPKPAADSSKNGKVKTDAPEILPLGLETRMEILPVPAGNVGNLSAVDGKLLYQRGPNSGSAPGPPSIFMYSIDEREEKPLLQGAMAYAVSGDGKSILARDPQGFGLIKPNPGQKLEKRLRTNEMEMVLIPKEEWKQIFNDTWRRYRDFFYDPNMHRVNWNNIRKEYGALLNDAITRWDVNTIQAEMISELSAGHTYAGGGDMEFGNNRGNGFLGIDWSLENGAYRIKKIINGAPWDNEVRSPFAQSGINIKAGDYILSVNGRKLDPAIDPYAMFEGLAGRAVALKVNDKPVMEGSREVIVKTLQPFEELRLRHLEWIEQNRKKVDEISGGQLGYMYMPNTGGQGQTELTRQFYAQINKKGFVIDERFNAGGQLGDRFVEMLNRPVIYNLAWRNAEVTVWPNRGNDGPKVMLINGWAGSGGDAFPWAFQQLKMGPIVGERTLGILVGPATTHSLIDGGYITVPDARLYGADGKWFAEGYGIKPDIEIWDDPAELTKGNDPQLLRAIQEVMKLVKEKPRVLHGRPAFEDRSGK